MLHDPLNDYNEVGRVLVAAARYLEEHGWCRGQAVLITGEVCILGALGTVIFGENSKFVDKTSLIKLTTDEVTNIIGGADRCSVIMWNDYLATDKEEVIATLYKAAEKHKVVA